MQSIKYVVRGQNSKMEEIIIESM